MTKNIRKFLKVTLTVTLFAGLVVGCFYLGVIFEQGDSKGFGKLVKEQGVNVFFGVIGGLITTALLWYLKVGAENFRLTGKHDKILSGVWDEQYELTEIEKNGQEQSLVFKIEHKGEMISGILTGNDNPVCPSERRCGFRLFSVQGHLEGKLVSLGAVLDSDESIGHTVYLLEVNHSCTILDGITIYYDQNTGKLTSSKTTLIKRQKKVLDPGL